MINGLELKCGMGGPAWVGMENGLRILLSLLVGAIDEAVQLHHM